MRKYLDATIILALIFSGGCEDEVANSGSPSIELSIERVDTTFQLNWTMDNEPDFFKYLVKAGTSSEDISEVIFETTDRMVLNHSVPFTFETKFFKVDVSNLDYDISSSNTVSINSEEIANVLSDDFRRCGETRYVLYELPSNQVIIEKNSHWNNYIQKRLNPITSDDEVIRTDTITYHYDNYGNILLVDYTKWGLNSTDSMKFSFTDYWKFTERIDYLNDGTIETTLFNWNDLTLTIEGNDTYWVEYNKYGNSIAESSGINFYYLEDGRRMYEQDSYSSRVITIWDGLKFERWHVGNSIPALRTGEIDIYGNIVEILYYDCESGDCIPTRKETFEYDCEKFDVIPIE